MNKLIKQERNLIPHQIHNCMVANCPCTSDSQPGRMICVEPDNDGWICERCYQNMHAPPLQVNIQINVSISIEQPQMIRVTR